MHLYRKLIIMILHGNALQFVDIYMLLYNLSIGFTFIGVRWGSLGRLGLSSLRARDGGFKGCDMNPAFIHKMNENSNFRP